MASVQFGVIGNGSWGTALTKILTDNLQDANAFVYWQHRGQESIDTVITRGHNLNYLQSASFNKSKLKLTTDVAELFSQCSHIVMAVPSAYVLDTVDSLPADAFNGKKIISAIKGMLPNSNTLLNEYLAEKFGVEISNYFSIMGPCHAEEVAAERLSYLTISGVDQKEALFVASKLKTPYINTITNTDIFGVQYAAILKNIYAVSSGMAHGLDYGDNFLSVLISNAADEMASFLRKSGVKNIEVGHENLGKNEIKHANYAASVYLGDLLVTCYSLHSRNRTFGNMIGKGYSVRFAQLEMNMVAEGYNASKSVYLLNKLVNVEMPIAETMYKILWEGLPTKEGFKYIESMLL